MNTNQRESLKYCLKRKTFKLSMRIVLSRMCSMIFLLYCFSVFHLLIYDTTFIVEIGLYENKVTAAFICFSAVLLGFILLLLAVWLNHKSKLCIYSVIDSVKITDFDVNYVLKLLIFKCTVAVIKISYWLMGVLPSALLTLLCFKLLTDGISIAMLVILSICDIILLINGLITSVILLQKLSLADICFAENKSMSIRQILKESEYLTDGKCCKMAKYKTTHVLFRILGRVIPYFSVRETAAEIFIATDKIIPHAHKKAHTEKAVVFYIGKKAKAG